MAEEGDDKQASNEDLEAEAREMGWSDKDAWRGPPEQWIDAKTFVERGRQILPIVRARSEQLHGELNQTRGRLQQMESALTAANAAIEALQEAHEEDTKEQVEAARRELRTQLAAASRDGDHDQVAELTDKMTQLNTAAADDDDKDKGRDKSREQPRRQPHPLQPEIDAWYAKNPDFVKSPRHVALANAISNELRLSGDTSAGAAFLDKVAAEVEKALGPASRGTSRVSSGNGGSGRRDTSSGGAKGYQDLPADAKEACDRQAKRLVGENRKHKTIDSWRASYAKTYFQE